MRRTVGLLAVALLSGCTTTVLETRRPAPAGQLWGDRTLVVADLDEDYRGATEDAIVRRLPGAVSASALPVDDHAESVWSSLFAGAADDSVFVWDTLVVLSVAHGVRHVRTPEGEVNIDDEGYERIDFRVSVFRTADRREIYGLTIRSTAGLGGQDTFGRLARYAADRAAKELSASDLFR
jgi:hypothetical protein